MWLWPASPDVVYIKCWLTLLVECQNIRNGWFSTFTCNDHSVKVMLCFQLLLVTFALILLYAGTPLSMHHWQAK